jgi:5-formyltetrahydrofolate cyclo-ligase
MKTTTRGALPIQMAKQDLRRDMRERRAAISPDEADRAAAAACTHALALPVWERARTVALYLAVRDELDAGPLERALTERGLTVVLPRVVAGPGELLHFHRIENGLQSLVSGPMGLLEPPADAPEAPLSTIDVFVVPALAFDPRGGRLGWGRGHFDATLAAAPGALRLGYAFELQIVPAVPESAGDERVDVIVTEQGARATGARPPEAPWRVRT